MPDSFYVLAERKKKIKGKKREKEVIKSRREKNKKKLETWVESYRGQTFIP